MTEVTALRPRPSEADLVVVAGLMMIGGGIVMVLRHPAAQEVLRRIAQNPDVRKVAAQIGRALLDSALRAIGPAALPPSAN